MTKEEVAEDLGISVRAVERLVTKGELRPTKSPKPGGGYRGVFEVDDVAAYKDRRGAVTALARVPTARETADTALEVAMEVARRVAEQTAALVEVVSLLRSERTLPALPVGVAEGSGDSTAEPAHQPRRRTLTVPIEGKPLLTLAESAALCGLGRDTLRKAITKRRLKASKVSGKWRVQRAALDSFVGKL